MRYSVRSWSYRVLSQQNLSSTCSKRGAKSRMTKRAPRNDFRSVTLQDISIRGLAPASDSEIPRYQEGLYLEIIVDDVTNHRKVLWSSNQGCWVVKGTVNVPLRPRFAAVTMFGECQDKREDLALLLLDRGKFVNVSKKSSEEHSRAEYGGPTPTNVSDPILCINFTLINYAHQKSMTSRNFLVHPKTLFLGTDELFSKYFQARWKLKQDDSISDIMSIIDTALNFIPSVHFTAIIWLHKYLDPLYAQFGKSATLSDLDQTIKLQELIVESTPENHSDLHMWLESLGVFLHVRFGRKGTLKDLNRAIAVQEAAVKFTPDGHEDLFNRLNNLSIVFQERFVQLKNLNDLDTAISLRDQALKIIPKDYPDLGIMLNSLATYLSDRFSRLKNMQDLDRAILIQEEVLKLNLLAHPDYHVRLVNSGVYYYTRYQKTGNLEDLDKAILIQDKAVEATTETHSRFHKRLTTLLLYLHAHPEKPKFLDKSIAAKEKLLKATPKDHPDIFNQLSTLGTLFQNRFTQMGNSDDLNKAITIQEDALKVVPEGYLKISELLNNLGGCLHIRFVQSDNIVDLNKAISVKEEAVKVTPKGHKDYISTLYSLYLSLQYRIIKQRELDNINKAIEILEIVVSALPVNVPYFCTHLDTMHELLLGRYQKTGSVYDLDKAIDVQEKSLQHTAETSPDLIKRLKDIGRDLGERFTCLGNMTDLDRAVSAQEQALKLTSNEHPEYSRLLNGLALSLRKEYQALGNLDTLKRAIALIEEALTITQDSYTYYHAYLINLGTNFYDLFMRTGDFNDLNKAIRILEQVVNSTSQEDIDFPLALGMLSASLCKRFLILGVLEDLNKAIIMGGKAVKLSSKDKRVLSEQLNDLAYCFQKRFVSVGNINDLDMAVATAESSLEATPENHTHRPVRLNNLGVYLQNRFEELGNFSDLEKAITVLEEALKLVPQDSLRISVILTSLASSLEYRFLKLGEIDDLNKAVKLKEKSLEVAPPGHPQLFSSLSSLASSFVLRFRILRNEVDCSLADKYFSDAVDITSASPWERFVVAIRWASWKSSLDSSSAITSYMTALQLFSEITTFGLNISDRHHRLSQVMDGLRDAVSVALKSSNVSLGLMWLEQGHSVVWNQLLQVRSSLQDLQLKYPIHGEKLEELSYQLESAATYKDIPLNTDEKIVVQGTISLYQSIAFEREKLLKNIRILPGFENFLLPKPVTDLQLLASSENPLIMINLSKKSCDALIISPDSVQHLPLLSFTWEKAEGLVISLKTLLHQLEIDQRGSRGIKLIEDTRLDPEAIFEYILAQLWFDIAKPILKHLGITAPLNSFLHITWCLNGPLSFLPLHAAGIYTSGYIQGSRLSEFVLSSYIPSLATLENCQQPRMKPIPKLLTVALPVESTLSSSEGEISSIRTILGPNVIQELFEKQATVENVKEAMFECGFVHFACHGEQNTSDPLQSAILLANGTRLTLDEIIKLKLPHGQLAFLSACQTATGDQKLPEEAIHLAAGMLVAGYRGVVATMWSIHDDDAPIVAKEFYKYLWKGGSPDVKQAAYALHYAVEKLRMKPTSFLQWVPFIHMGI